MIVPAATLKFDFQTLVRARCRIQEETAVAAINNSALVDDSSAVQDTVTDDLARIVDTLCHSIETQIKGRGTGINEGPLFSIGAMVFAYDSSSAGQLSAAAP